MPEYRIYYSTRTCPDPEIRDSDLCGMSQYCKYCRDDRNRSVRDAVDYLADTGQIDPSFASDYPRPLR